MAKSKIKQLNQDQIDLIIDDTLIGAPINDTLKKIGMNRRLFREYLKAYPEFKLELSEAEKDSCFFLENDMLNVHLSNDKPREGWRPEWGKPTIDPKLASVRLNSISKRLAFLMPDKYGNKLDLNLNQNISIKDNIDKANSRITEYMRDVTPLLNDKKVG